MICTCVKTNVSLWVCFVSPFQKKFQRLMELVLEARKKYEERRNLGLPVVPQTEHSDTQLPESALDQSDDEASDSHSEDSSTEHTDSKVLPSSEWADLFESAPQDSTAAGSETPPPAAMSRGNRTFFWNPNAPIFQPQFQVGLHRPVSWLMENPPMPLLVVWNFFILPSSLLSTILWLCHWNKIHYQEITEQREELKTPCLQFKTNAHAQSLLGANTKFSTVSCGKCFFSSSLSVRLRGCGISSLQRLPPLPALPQCAGAGCIWPDARSGTGRPSWSAQCRGRPPDQQWTCPQSRHCDGSPKREEKESTACTVKMPSIRMLRKCRNCLEN